MKTSDLIITLDATLWTNENSLNNSFNDVYVGDLLSNILGHAKECDALVTIMANMNTIAVGSLLDFTLIIFAEGIKPTNEMIEKANEENIALLSSPLSATNIIRKIYTV